MFKCEAYYYENIRPIVRDYLIDYLELGSTECPDFSNLPDDVAEALSAKLFIADKDNYDPIADLEFKFVIAEVFMKKNEGHQYDLEYFISEKLTNYYAEAITEILDFEFEGVFNEYQDGLCEQYEIDSEC